MCEKNEESRNYFFNHRIIITTFSAGSLLVSEIFTLGKILQLSADHHALVFSRSHPSAFYVMSLHRSEYPG